VNQGSEQLDVFNALNKHHGKQLKAKQKRRHRRNDTDHRVGHSYGRKQAGKIRVADKQGYEVLKGTFHHVSVS
jgi:hypothetical protein